MLVYLVKTTEASEDVDDEGNRLPVGTVINRILWDGETDCDPGLYEMVPENDSTQIS